MVDQKFPVFIFVGEEEYLKDKAVQSLKISVLGKPSDPDFKTFYPDSATSAEILEFAGTMPFSSPKRFLVIKDFEDFPAEERDRILAYCAKPSQSSCVVICVDEERAIGRMRPIPSCVCVREFRAPRQEDMASVIIKTASSRGKKMGDDAASLLAELRGTELSGLDEEMDKIAAFVGGRDVITADDVEAVSGRSFTSSAFDIIWAVGSRDVDRAIALTRELVIRGKRPNEIVGILSWHMKRLVKAVMMRKRGVSDHSIASGLKLPGRYARDFFRQVDSVDLDRIRSRMEILLKADLDIKSSGFDQALIFETAIVRLCLG